MHQGSRWTPWLHQLAVIVAFCAVYPMLHAVQLMYWTPQAGLRFALALLLPRRFWGAILLADILSAAPSAYECLPQYGLSGALLHLVPVSSFAMVLIALLRGRLSVPQLSGRSTAFSALWMVLLLACAAAYSLLITADSTLQIILTIQPADHVPASVIVMWSIRFFLGAYLGCLLVVPLALAALVAFEQAGTWRMLARNVARSRLLLEGVVLGVFGIGLLTALSNVAIGGDAGRQISRLLMFAPVAWMALRWGWRGAAVGGTAVSVGIVLTLPSAYDPGSILAQWFVAFIITTLLPIGSRIDVLNVQRRQAQRDLKRRQHAARRELVRTELRIRETTQDMEQIYDTLQMHYGHLLERMGTWLSEGAEKRHRADLMKSKQRMLAAADRVHPLHRHDLSSALRDGPIARALEDFAFVYAARVSDAVNTLTPGAQMVLYRLAGEAVALKVSNSPPRQRIELSVRVVRLAEASWAVLTVTRKPVLDDNVRVLPTLASRSWDELILRLGSQHMRVTGMRDIVGVFDGKVRAIPKRERIMLTLLDAQEKDLMAIGAHEADLSMTP